MEGRVRADPRRTEGNANLLASGHPAPSFVTISEATLSRYEDIATGAAIAAQEARLEERKARSDASKTRMNAWGDTLMAKRKQYITDRSNRLDADEQRRQRIDAEEAEYRETKRQQRLHEASMQLLDRDERGRQMRTAVLAHEVVQQQQWQIAQGAEKKAIREEDEREYADGVKRRALEEVEEKAAAAAKIKEKLAAVKQEQWAMLEQAVEQRRSEKKQLVLDAEEIRRAAEAEMQENSTRRAQRRAAEIALKEDLMKQMSPRLSPRQKLQQQSSSSVDASPDHLDANIQKHQAQKENQQKMLSELARTRQERHEQLVHQATALLATISSTPSKKERAVDTFAAVPSMSHRLIAQSDIREQTMAQNKRDVTAAPSPRSMRSTHGLPIDSAVERNFNELRSPRFRERLDQQIQMLDRFDDEQRRQQREDAKYLAMVRQMQAAEKKHQKALERNADVEEALRCREGREEEDALFRDFVEAHLPENLSPRLAKTARGIVGCGGKYMGRGDTQK